jgi:hypothetical protein
MRDLVELMQEATDRLRIEVEKAEKLKALQENDELRAALEHAEVTRANTLGLLNRLKGRNGTEAEDLRRHREILTKPFLRRSA